ncbi:hypothetical protein GCM10027277_01980 [Pseudoduganella ginsengisoli]|uniref:Uncharacterized protein n=1 Tax=Pseudoduganella ginsengisoli TaxID=1462440 RepID=A0A6L6Q879_9BURK|nr:hypothetical protein [Pseudoduganella ginsengisoli]MTW05820.1 hypothetical protein [Pseudoduganella ginsengisoli]
MNAATVQRPLPWWLRDFRHMRLAALVFAVAAACAAAAVVSTRALWHDARSRQVQAAHTRDLARRQFAQVDQEKRDIALFQPIYQQLLARHLVGAENRLDWVGALRQMQDQYGLGPIAYDIAPRQPVVMSPAMDLGRFSLYATRMRIQIDLLHEGDLFTLLAGLRAQGHSTVQECTLKRPASAPNAPLAPTVTATCTLNWVTLADGAVPDTGTMAGVVPAAPEGALAARASEGAGP